MLKHFKLHCTLRLYNTVCTITLTITLTANDIVLKNKDWLFKDSIQVVRTNLGDPEWVAG